MGEGEFIYKTISVPMLTKFNPEAAWSFEPDPKRSDGYSVIGQDDDGELRRLTAYDSFNGASSASLDADGIPSEWIMDRPKAEELHDRIQVMDEVYWPGFNPLLVRVKDHQIVEDFMPSEGSSE